MPTANALPNQQACLQNSKANKDTAANKMPLFQTNEGPEIQANEETYQMPSTSRIMPSSHCCPSSNPTANI